MLGVARELENADLKRCVRKGWVKVQQTPANRYLYYLTPKGFAEKRRITTEYLVISLSFYRQAGNSCARFFEQGEKNEWRRVWLCGVSDLAAIATLRTMELERSIAIAGIYDPASKRKQLLGKRVWRELRQADVHDVRILTDFMVASDWHAELCGKKGEIPLLAPDVLRAQIDQL